MNDDGLRAQLERRSNAASFRAEELLPGVNRGIGVRSRPARVARWAPLAGLAAAAVIVVALVIAFPGGSPSKSPGSSTAGGTSALEVMSTDAFASALQRGALAGQTVLVNGGIVNYDGPAISGVPCSSPATCLLVLGQIENVQPRLTVLATEVAVTSSSGASMTQETGWPWWVHFTLPVHGTLMLSVDETGQVEYIGRVVPNGDGLSWSAGEVKTELDLTARDLDEVVLVNAWLTGVDFPAPCMSLPTTFPGLPDRNGCGRTSWVADEAAVIESQSVNPPSAIQVQPAAFATYAPDPTARTGDYLRPQRAVYALARRLYGQFCIDSSTPCWDWSVVGRLSQSPPAVGPSSLPYVPTPELAPTPTASIVPTSLVLTQADFVDRRNRHELDGTTVLVTGSLVSTDHGVACMPTSCPDSKLDGTDVIVSTPLHAIEESNGTEYGGSITWPWWDGPALPVTGSLTLSTNAAGGVEYLGLAASTSAIDLSEVSATTPDGTLADSVLVVDGWLSERYSQSPECPAPNNYVSGLGSRFCNPSTLTGSSGALEVQEGAYQDFAPNPAKPSADGVPDPQFALYLVAPRLEGGDCPNDKTPCWQWEIVGRLNSTIDATPTPTAVPLPSANELACGTGWPLRLSDFTGLVTSCDVSAYEPGWASGLVTTDASIKVGWRQAMCSGDLTGSFEQVDRGYELAIDEQPLVYPSAAPTCAGGIEPLTLTLSLTNPVPSGVFATVNGQDLPNLSPSAEPSLSIGAIACGHVTGVSGDASSPPDHESSVWILDRTGMLRDCFASNSLPDGRTVEVTNTEPSNHTINLSWSGNSCDTSATLNFETTEAGYSWLARRKQGLPAARALPSASAF